MKFLGIILSSLFAFSAFANTAQFECTKGTDTLSFEVGTHTGNGPKLSGIRLNDLNGGEGYLAFNELLSASKKCEDLNLYLRLDKSEVLLCEGEMIAPNAIYGQVIMSKGALEILKNTIAPAAGWSCN